MAGISLGILLWTFIKKTDNFICSMVKVYQNACILWCDSEIEVFMSSDRQFLYFGIIRFDVYVYEFHSESSI